MEDTAKRTVLITGSGIGAAMAGVEAVVSDVQARHGPLETVVANGIAERVPLREHTDER